MNKDAERSIAAIRAFRTSPEGAKRRRSFNKAARAKDYATLLEMALDDFKIVTSLPGIKKDFSLWLKKTERGCYYVGLEGAVILRTLVGERIPMKFCLDPPYHNAQALWAIDDLRMGRYPGDISKSPEEGTTLHKIFKAVCVVTDGGEVEAKPVMARTSLYRQLIKEIRDSKTLLKGTKK